jgi:hypothetical protein
MLLLFLLCTLHRMRRHVGSRLAIFLGQNLLHRSRDGTDRWTSCRLKVYTSSRPGSFDVDQEFLRFKIAFVQVTANIVDLLWSSQFALAQGWIARACRRVGIVEDS